MLFSLRVTAARAEFFCPLDIRGLAATCCRFLLKAISCLSFFSAIAKSWCLAGSKLCSVAKCITSARTTAPFWNSALNSAQLGILSDRARSKRPRIIPMSSTEVFINARLRTESPKLLIIPSVVNVPNKVRKPLKSIASFILRSNLEASFPLRVAATKPPRLSTRASGLLLLASLFACAEARLVFCLACTTRDELGFLNIAFSSSSVSVKSTSEINPLV